MDNIDISFIEESTKIHRSPIIVNPRAESSTLKFTVISEDPDKLNTVHIDEGAISVDKFEKENEERTKEIFFGFPGMEGEAWKYAEKKLPIQIYKGRVAITMVAGQHHTINKSIEQALKVVLNYPGNEGRLILTADFDTRQTGVALVTARIVNEAFIKSLHLP